MRRILGALMAVALFAYPVQAQQTGTLTVGGFADFTLFDNEVGFTELPGLGAGGFVGFFVLPNLAVEASALYDRGELGATGEDAGFLPLQAHLVYNYPASEGFYPMIGLGFARQKYTGALGDQADNAISGLLGFKSYLTEKLALRMDARVNYAFSPFNEGGTIEHHTNATFTMGFSWDVLGGRTGDGDGDGVSDNADACPGTPSGVRVDARGCRVDEDGDGIFVEDDECPDTPRGAAVDAAGCRLDSDGDGVFDEDDRCPATPAGTEVNAEGCPVDADGDGVEDSVDQCPATPAGATVDASGCRPDADADGVPDDVDQCPATPAGAEVDEQGCEDIFAEGPEVFLEGVTFETGNAVLTEGSFAVLDEVAASLVANPEERVLVVGHTDNTGDREFNIQLSLERAQAVVDYLVSRGVAADRLEAEGRGPDDPVASNDTAEGRADNRRVELDLISN